MVLQTLAAFSNCLVPGSPQFGGVFLQIVLGYEPDFNERRSPSSLFITLSRGAISLGFESVQERKNGLLFENRRPVLSAQIRPFLKWITL